MIRIAICDDHPLFRAGLIGLLRDEGDMRVAVEAGSAAEIVQAVGKMHAEIDLTLLDLDLPDQHGVEIVAMLADRVRVLVISAFDDPRIVRTALERGAAGFVRKDAPPATLLQGIRDAARGRPYSHRSSRCASPGRCARTRPIARSPADSAR